MSSAPSSPAATAAPVDQALRAQLERMRRAQDAQGHPDVRARRAHLSALLEGVRRYEDALVAAVGRDWGYRSPHETRLGDLFPTIAAIKHVRRHVRRWMRMRRVPTSLLYVPARNRLVYEPLGVVGIMAPWNYPVQLALVPLAEALAAGNRVMVKPSDMMPATSEVLATLVAEVFADDHVEVITGDVEVARAFSALPFDHLFFTGSTTVGRAVMRAASENLVPVTLELGGKSPAIVQRDYDHADAAMKIVIGKLFNAGQTCIAPDYVLVHASRRDELVDHMRRAVGERFPGLPHNPDYSAIAGDRHHARLSGLLEDARAKGGRVEALVDAAFDPRERKLPPTVVLDATQEMQLMQEEIFGPILPVFTYDELDEAFAFVRARPKPLTLYYFDDNRSRVETLLARTSSGGVAVNETLVQFVQESLPFGGVGPSGMGSYHGFAGFRAFSNERGVFFQSRFSGVRLLWPPYGQLADRLTRWLLRWGR